MIQNTRAKIFAPSKVAIHRERIEAYLRGENIYPVTIEMDLTQRCTRACPACPYSTARSAGLTLELPFLERLFRILGSHTPGLVLSGGEPTIGTAFPGDCCPGKGKRIQGGGSHIEREHASPPESPVCPC